MAQSAGVFIRVIENPPLEEVGWEVRVVAYSEFEHRNATGGTGDPLAIISKVVDVSISPAISQVGAASVTLDLDDEFWTYPLTTGASSQDLLDYEHLWQVFENGALRAEFLGTTRSETFLSESETRAVTIAGPMGGDVLRWAKVMTPTYPLGSASTAAGRYYFINVAIMSAYLQLLQAAQARGTIGFVQPTCTYLADSAGQAWADTPIVPADVPGSGTTVLSGDVNFAFGSYTLTSTALTNIAAMVAKFAGATPHVTVVGHTDWVGGTAYNQTLSENRANAVADQIRTLAPAAVITHYGRGETQPIATNNTAAGRATNRRVTVTYPILTTPPPATNPVFEPSIGQNLLDLLNEICGNDPNKSSAIRAEWVMWPGFKLDVRRQFGTHREGDVIFYEGASHSVSKQRVRTSSDVANLVAVYSDWGDYSIATDGNSVARWRQREEFLQEGAVYDTSIRATIANARLGILSDEKSSWTIVVEPYAPGRRVFEDYTLGDWIGVARNLPTGSVVEAFRVMALTLHVDSDNVVSLELTLQSRFEAHAQRLQTQITSLVTLMETGNRTFVQDEEPFNASIGDFWTPRTS